MTKFTRLLADDIFEPSTITYTGRYDICMVMTRSRSILCDVEDVRDMVVYLHPHLSAVIHAIDLRDVNVHIFDATQHAEVIEKVPTLGKNDTIIMFNAITREPSIWKTWKPIDVRVVTHESRKRLGYKKLIIIKSDSICVGEYDYTRHPNPVTGRWDRLPLRTVDNTRIDVTADDLISGTVELYLINKLN